MTTPVSLRVFESHARTYRHTWRGSAISTFLTPILFLTAMGLGLGTLVDRGDGTTTLLGLSYLQFLAPGLLVTTAMQTGAGDAAWPVMAGIKWLRTYHAALATPVTTRHVMYGHLLWVGARLLLVAVVNVVIMWMFGALGLWEGLAASLPAVLTGLAFAAPVTAFTSKLESEVGLTALFRFGIIPLFLFSGAFFPISQLPGFVQPVAWLVPTWHGIEVAREWTTGIEAAGPVSVHLAILIGFIALGTVLAVTFFDRRMRT